MSSLLAILAAALGASVAGVHASTTQDGLCDRFDRWVGVVLVAGAVILSRW